MIDILQKLSQKIKRNVQNPTNSSLFLIFTLIFASFTSFTFGYLEGKTTSQETIQIEYPYPSTKLGDETVETQQNFTVQEGVVVSKNGSKYHYPWCSGAQRIKEENKIIFENKEEAEKSGYEPASNCPGL